jgi:hypothetical protein
LLPTSLFENVLGWIKQRPNIPAAGLLSTAILGIANQAEN